MIGYKFFIAHNVVWRILNGGALPISSPNKMDMGFTVKDAKLLRKQGYLNALELDWGEHTKVGVATVHFVECQHRSGRGAFDQMKTLWGSFVVETPEGAIYFAGDIG